MPLFLSPNLISFQNRLDSYIQLINKVNILFFNNTGFQKTQFCSYPRGKQIQLTPDNSNPR